MTVPGSWQDVLLGAAVMAPRERERARARSVLALLARFAAGQGIPASPRWLLDYDVDEAFCVRGCAGRAGHPRHLPVSAVSAGRAGARCCGVAGNAVCGAKAPPPYSPGERAELATIAGRSAARPGVPGAGDGGVRDRGGAAVRGAGRAARQRHQPPRPPGHGSCQRGRRPGGAGRRALCRTGSRTGPRRGRGVRVLPRPGGPGV